MALPRLGRIALLACALQGCTCEREDRHPYTPFGVANQTSSATASSVTPIPSAPAAFVRRPATRIAPQSATVPWGGETLSAPEGRKFAAILPLAPEPNAGALVAWLVALKPDLRTPPGSLWLFEPGKAARELAGFPGVVPSGPDCRHDVAVELSGPQSISLDVSARCTSAGIPRAPTRSLRVLESGTGRLLLGLRLAEPVAGDQLQLQVDSSDRDNDGHDDILLRVGLLASGAKSSSAVRFAWFDRASGATRDFSEPQQGFAELARSALARSKGDRSAAAPAQIDQARRLYAYVCAEAQSPRLTDGDGKPLSCGDLKASQTDLVRAEVQAWAQQRDWARALFALDRADWHAPALGSAVRSELERAVLKGLPQRPAELRAIPLRALASGSGPRLSPLAFDASGRVLVQTPGGLMRIEQGIGVDASEEVDAWPLIQLSRDGRRVTGLSYPCDASWAAVQAQDSSGRSSAAIETDLLAPRPGACSANAKFFEPEVRVAAWHGAAPSVFVGPLAFGPHLAAGTLGSPVSANGRHQISLTSLGLLLQTRAVQAPLAAAPQDEAAAEKTPAPKPSSADSAPNGQTPAGQVPGGQAHTPAPPSAVLWVTPNSNTLSECVVNNAANLVACLQGTQVVLLTAP